MKSKIMAVWMVAVLVFSSAFVMIGNEAKADNGAAMPQSAPGESLLDNGTFGGGDGTIGNPYIIEDVYDLQAVIPNQHFILGNDIDATETATWNAGAGFIPIGTPGYFYGTLEGAGYVIYNLTINSATADYVGLFMTIYDTAKVSNLTMVNCNIACSILWCHSGMLAGNNYGTITNCGVSGSVFGESRAGGLVAYNEGTITDSYSSGYVSCPGDPAGGFVADNFGTISNCYSTCDVLTGWNVGGFVSMNGDTITNCYSTGNVIGVFGYGGGFVAENNNIISGTITNCYSTGSATGCLFAGGFMGYYDSGMINGCLWDIETSGTVVGLGLGSTGGIIGATTAQMKTQAFISGAGFTFGTTPGSANWFIIGGQTRPFLQAEYSTVIYTSHQVQLMAMDPAADYVLACDVNMSDIVKPSQMWGTSVTLGTGFMPIGTFSGSLDGQENSILGLFIKRPTTDHIGLFKQADTSADLSNISLLDCVITGKSYTAGLVGYNENIILNCFVEGMIVGTGNYVGGITGENWGSINASYASCEVTGVDHVGGLAGELWSSISDCYATGKVTGNSMVGGLVGNIEFSSAANCYSTGNVTGTSLFGGLTGYTEFGGAPASYWDTQSSGIGFSALGTPINTTQAMTEGTYIGWDFSNIWDIKENYSYPFFIWNQFNSAPIAFDDEFTADEDLIFNTGNVTEDNGFGADLDIDGDMLTVVELDGDPAAVGNPTTIASGAIVTIYWDGTFIYDANDSFEYLAVGSWQIDSFEYTVFDNNDSDDSATVFVNITGENDFPVIQNADVTEATQDILYSVSYIASDDMGDTDTWSLNSNASWLGIVPATGVLSGTPVGADVGSYWVNVTVTDQLGLEVWTNLTLTVIANVPPVITTADVTSATEDALYYVDYNATDANLGDILTWSLVTDAGWLGLVSATGILSGIPINADVGTYWVNVSVSDGNGGSDYRNFTLTVSNTNDAPVMGGASGSFTFTEGDAPTFIDASLTITDVDDTSIEGAMVQITGNYLVGEDVLSILSPGTITCIWNAPLGRIEMSGTETLANYETALESIMYGNADDSPSTLARTVSWTVNDGDVNSNTATSTINVVSVNDAPTVTDMSKTGTEDTTVTFIAADFTGHFTDPDGDSMTQIQVTSLPANGELRLSGTPVTLNQEIVLADLGNLAFVPDSNWNGATSFDWNGRDGSVYALSSAKVNITVNGLNDFPTLTDVIKTGTEDTTLTFLAVDFTGHFSDPDGDSITQIQVTSLPANGELRLSGTPVTLNQEIVLADLGNLAFVPDSNWNGATSFDWNGRDGSVYALSPAKVNITVNGVFDSPILNVIGNKIVNEEVLLSFTATATDSDADPLNFSLDAGAPTGASINSTGYFAWTPTEAQGPNVYSVTVRVSDGSLEDFETFTITVGEVNLSPVLGAIGNQTVSEEALLTFTATATDADLPANTLTFSLDAGYPTGANITSGGVFTWTPTEAQGPGFFNITVRVSDGSLEDFEKFMITVNEVNLAPTLGAIGNKAVNEGTALTFTATATDTDLPANTLTYSLDPGFPTGAAINSTTGAFSWTPTESQGPNVYSVTIRVSDGTAQDFVTFTITVAEVNQAPVLGVIGNRIISEQSYYSFMATATDSDMPANTLTFSLGAGYPAGAAISAAGLFTWTPTEAQGPGVYPVTISVSDGITTDSETFTVTVLDINVAPVARNDVFTIDEDSGVNALNVRVNDIDHDGDTLTVTAVTQGLHGTVTIVGASLEYEPNADFYGTDSFTYTVSDGNGGTSTATVTVTVASVNDHPTAADDAVTIPEDCGAATFYVLVNDGFAPDSSETLTITSVTQGTHGAVVKSADGMSLTYEPALNFWGTDTFTYTISDGHGGTDTATVSVTVYNVNDSPVIITENVTQAVSGNNYRVDYVATDIDGDTLVWNLTTTAAWLSIDPATGVLSGMAEAGLFSVRIIVSDGKVGYGVQTFTLEVEDIDSDGDGVLDLQDAFPDNAAETLDTDGDGTGNGADTDDDADGVTDSDDAFPLNPAESVDTDGDGIGNNADGDDDGDGIWDTDDSEPLNSAETGMEYEPDAPYIHVVFIFCIVLLIGLIGLAVVWLMTRKN